jgi:hypothetical protein
MISTSDPESHCIACAADAAACRCDDRATPAARSVATRHALGTRRETSHVYRVFYDAASGLRWIETSPGTWRTKVLHYDAIIRPDEIYADRWVAKVELTSAQETYWIGGPLRSPAEAMGRVTEVLRELYVLRPAPDRSAVPESCG